MYLPGNVCVNDDHSFDSLVSHVVTSLRTRLSLNLKMGVTILCTSYWGKKPPVRMMFKSLQTAVF